MASPQRKLNAAGTGPLARRLAEFVAAAEPAAMPGPVIEKARGCLADFLACALEAGDLPWGRQAIAYAALGPQGPATVVGAGLKVAAPEAAFANGTLGHGLVREDMHVASCTHLGVVVWPTLLALAEMEDIDDDDFLAAGVLGYEIGACIGRALFDPELAARIRPTGTIGAMAGAAAGARLLGLDADQTTAALALAANAASGLNEWPWAGGSDVFFHAGTAARNALTAVLLARAGAVGSPTAIDGRSGLFAAYGRQARAADVTPLADGKFEILAVYWKPAPACNFVQTPCQAALGVVRQGVRAADVAKVQVTSFAAALEYPGCDQPGPFSGVLAAKMSLQYSVAATLVRGAIDEANYRLTDDPEVLRLAAATSLSTRPDLEAAYPARQGAEVTVTLRDGSTVSQRQDDVQALDAPAVRRRLVGIAGARLGDPAARSLLEAIDALGKGGSAGAVLKVVARR